MKQERLEQGHYAGYAQDLREKFQSGLLSELLPYPHFVVWKYTLERGKLKKRPFNPKTHMPAKTNDPSTWTDLHQSLKALATGRYNGIGFVFSRADPFTGIDLDACVSKEGNIAQWAKEIITTLATYTEYSPSKLGVHCLTNAALPGKGRKIGDIEMYTTERFFTVTADHVAGTPTTIEHRQEAIEALYRRFATQVEKGVIQNTRVGVGSGSVLTELPEEAASDQVLQCLLRGDMTGYSSQSSADFVLALKLLHWTGDNVELTRKLFVQSGLYRAEKTERKTGATTYLDMTIYNALRKRRNPPQKR
jgi:putative DNA primase/helicase